MIDSTNVAAGVDLRNARRQVSDGWFKLPRGKKPPQAPEAEQAVVGCLLLSPSVIDQLEKSDLDAFYDLRNETIVRVVVEMFNRMEFIDLITVVAELEKQKLLAGIGGLPYLNACEDSVPSASNFPYWLALVREKFRLREIVRCCSQVVESVYDAPGDVQPFLNHVRAVVDSITREKGATRTPLKIWRVGELEHYVPPNHLELVGDQEIVMGYEGVCVVAGPGSSGKSLCVSTLAVMGAIGAGLWMGRKVHRRFRTLIIQAENGTRRLKKEVEAYIANHAEHAPEIRENIFFSQPPEGGLPFHHGEFRNAVRRAIEEFKPDLVVIDPWSMVAAEDAAKEVVDKLNEIRSCFPPGEACPGLLIIAHTKKPRTEDVRKGRGLTYLVSGSIALPNTARCVYVLLPWTEDLTDPRIYWTCCKLNDGEMYAPTVWQRKFGRAFEHDEKTDPREWGRSDGDERGKITDENLRDAFDNRVELKKSDLAKRLAKLSGAALNTAYRALDEDGYLRGLIMRTGQGSFKLKEPNE